MLKFQQERLSIGASHDWQIIEIFSTRSGNSDLPISREPRFSTDEASDQAQRQAAETGSASHTNSGAAAGPPDSGPIACCGAASQLSQRAVNHPRAEFHTG